MQTLPLIAHDRPEAVVAYRGGVAINAAQFLHDVRTLAARLPAASHVLNLCSDRYRFTVALSAAMLREQLSLLPSTHTPEVIRHLREYAADVYCLSDDRANTVDLPLEFYPQDLGVANGEWSVPRIDVDRVAAYIFTSGSTGMPLPYAKVFGRLVQCVQAEAERLGHIGPGAAILGTVPPQHMYGIESTVLLPLHSGAALCAERPFFPADVAAALQALPRPRVLFSTPVHLRALVSSELALPAIDLIVSATAMLPMELAHEVERRFHVPLLEIYGSTETGQIATRRTTAEEPWHLWPDVQLAIEPDGRCFVSGGHVAQPTVMADVLERRGSEHFLLHGRTADLVNIAGKRSSLAYLNHQLNAIDGVIDGVFFLREDPAGNADAPVSRLMALVVAPQLEVAQIQQALRERIDPVFLPRPLLRVAQLPRNATGKLPRETLQALMTQALASSTDVS